MSTAAQNESTSDWPNKPLFPIPADSTLVPISGSENSLFYHMSDSFSVYSRCCAICDPFPLVKIEFLLYHERISNHFKKDM